jgi:tripartite-type tricarboxylate transporter receptor subunit TctC
MKSLYRLACGAAACLTLIAAQAQTYPAKAVRIIVPFSAGGTVDLVARVLAQELSTQTGQQFFVDNRPGASGVIGSDAVAKSSPDGYTLLVQAPTLIANPLMVKKVPYVVTRDFTPVSLLGSVPMVMTVNSGISVKTLGEFIAQARTHPAAYTFGTSAIGSPMHVAGEAIKHEAKIDIAVVPYKGTANALNDLLGGQISAMIDAIPSTAPHIASGKLRALAVTSKVRVASLPNVPTMAESGLPGFEMVSWYGLWGPAGLPADVIKRLSAEVAKAVKAPLVSERLGSQGFIAVGSTPQQFSDYIDKEIAMYTRVVKEAHIQID